MSLTDYGEEQIIDHLFRDGTFVKPNAGNGSYLAAFTSLPAEDGSGFVEPVYSQYQRPLIPHDNAEWAFTPDTDGVVAESASPRSWPTPLEDGPPIIGAGIVDAASGGNIILAGRLGSVATPETIPVTNGQAISLDADKLRFRFGNAFQRVCDPFALAVLRHILGGDTWAKYSQIEMTLCTTLYGKAGTGGVEYSGNGYTPAVAGPNSALWNAPAQAAEEASTNNREALELGTPSVDWSGIAGHILKAGSTILMRQPYSDAPRAFLAGRKVVAPEGTVQFSIN